MFSVIIPTHNRLGLLKRAINSVLNQTFKEFEIIVVDDCSSDGTWEWLTNIDNKRIKPYRNSRNKGLSFNRNFGASKSIKPFVAFLDDDDIWYSNHLSELKMIIAKFPNAGMYCNSYTINYGDKKVDAIYDNKFLTDTITEFSKFKCFKNKNALCAPSSIAIPKSIFDKIGGFNSNTTVLEDIEFYIKIGLKFKIVKNRIITIEYAQNTGNHLSLNHIHKKILPDLSLFKEEEKKYPFLKEWLDTIRFQIGIKFLEASNTKCMFYFKEIKRSNIPLIKRLFLNLNYSLMTVFIKINRALK